VDTEGLDGLVARLRQGETVPATDLPMVVEDRFAGGVLGLVWDSLSLDRLTAHLEIRPEHHQPYGIVHGGVWCAVVETVASVGAALHAAAHGKVVVGVSNSTDFLRAQRSGRVVVEGAPVHVGRTQQLWQVVIRRDDDGKPVARGQVRLQAIDPAQVAG
jgi:1,4-dihydroxy-2-naphthoyl-CoA hydrolase